MQNRTRNKQLNLKFTEDEFEYIKHKKELSQIRNYTDFILYIATHSMIYNVDIKPIIDLENAINKIGVNVNQIAKIVNTTGNVYKNEIEDLQRRIKSMQDVVKDFHIKFAKNKELNL